MDLHIYTRELLDKHLLPELKEIAQALGIVPDGNKTRRETWVAALVGQPFPVFQTIENSPGVDQSQESIEPSDQACSTRSRNLIPWDFNLPEEDYDPDIHGDIIDRSESGAHCPGCGSLGYDNYPDGFILGGYRIVEKCIDCGNHFYESRFYQQLADVVDQRQEPIKNCAGVDHIEESEFPDLESALAEIARLRAQNKELLELVRRAKDISPVEKPSLKRVLHLAQAACLDVFKSAEGRWTLSMGHLRRSFKKLRDIWELLMTDDWYLTDLFSPSSSSLVPKPLFPPIHSKYSAIPFSNDGLIDTWSLGVNVASSGRSPPAGGDAM